MVRKALLGRAQEVAYRHGRENRLERRAEPSLAVGKRAAQALLHALDPRFARLLGKLALFEVLEGAHVELAEEMVAPVVPHLRGDGSHVREGHDVELLENLDAADVPREIDDHAAVVEVAMLRDV